MNLDTLDNSHFAQAWRRVMRNVWTRLAVAVAVFCIAFVSLTFALPFLVPAVAEGKGNIPTRLILSNVVVLPLAAIYHLLAIENKRKDRIFMFYFLLLTAFSLFLFGAYSLLTVT